MWFDMLNGLASSYRPYHELSQNGVYDKPSLASAEKGQLILRAAVESIQELIESYWKDVQ